MSFVTQIIKKMRIKMNKNKIIYVGYAVIFQQKDKQNDFFLHSTKIYFNGILFNPKYKKIILN